MKAERFAGAASGISPHWREVDWRSVSQDVRRLQVRIVKAVETGRWGKVKGEPRTHTIRHGRCTSRNAKAGTWPTPLRAVPSCFTSGGLRAESALRAVSRSLGRQVGIATTSSQRSSAGTTAPQTASFCTRSVIVNCTAVSATSTAASRKRRLEGLSRVSWKLSRTVLRGAVGGNTGCLLDEKAGKPPKQPYSFELANGSPIGFAGLWDAWKDKDGHWLQSFAIVTTEANELMI